MPTFTYTVSFGLSEYFDFYGFEDGENTVLNQFALRERPRALSVLNLAMKKHNLPFEAVPEDIGSLHNNILIELQFASPGGGRLCYLPHPNSGTIFEAVRGVPQEQIDILNRVAFQEALRNFEAKGKKGGRTK